MTSNVARVVGAGFPAGVDFPLLEAVEYGWRECSALTAQNIARQCGRVVVSAPLLRIIELKRLKNIPWLKSISRVVEAHADSDRILVWRFCFENKGVLM